MGVKVCNAPGAFDRSAVRRRHQDNRRHGAARMAKIVAMQPMLCANITTGAGVRRIVPSRIFAQALRSGTSQSCCGTRVAALPNCSCQTVCQ